MAGTGGHSADPAEQNGRAAARGASYTAAGKGEVEAAMTRRTISAPAGWPAKVAIVTGSDSGVGARWRYCSPAKART